MGTEEVNKKDIDDQQHHLGSQNMCCLRLRRLRDCPSADRKCTGKKERSTREDARSFSLLVLLIPLVLRIPYSILIAISSVFISFSSLLIFVPLDGPTLAPWLCFQDKLGIPAVKWVNFFHVTLLSRGG